MASFNQNIRMAQLYPPSYINPNGQPSEGDDLFSRFENEVLPALRRERGPLRGQVQAMQMADLFKPHLDNVNQQPNIGPSVNATGTAALDKSQNAAEEGMHGGLSAKERATADALKLKQKTESDTLGLKYSELGLKQQLADLKIPEAAKLELLNKYKLGQIDETGGQTRKTLGLKQIGDAAIQNLKGEQQLNNTRAIGDNQQNLENQRQPNRLELQGARDTAISGRQATGQENTLAQIAARGDEARRTQDNKPVTSLQPSQVTRQYRNNADQIMNSNPAWAGFIKKNPDGSFIVTPPGPGGPDEQTFHDINAKIYGTGGSDIKLPNETPASPKKIESPKKVVTPIQSKYKVTVTPGKK